MLGVVVRVLVHFAKRFVFESLNGKFYFGTTWGILVNAVFLKGIKMS